VSLSYQQWLQLLKISELNESLALPVQANTWLELEHTLSQQFQSLSSDYLHLIDSILQLPRQQGVSPEIQQGRICFSSDSMRDGAELRHLFRQFMPWKKGPFQINDVWIDSEWRSDFKWERIQSALGALNGDKILDVGCGNAYHGWRMLDDGAECVLGIDPSWLFNAQFNLIRQFSIKKALYHLPLSLEQMPTNMDIFDKVFSMGVLYHRRSPVDHLMQLRQFIRPGGQLLLETLIIDGGENTCLVPHLRYAKMRNVWFIPSVITLTGWLERCGYKDIQVLDINQTGFDEQRRTEWMSNESLADFLDPGNPDLTLEGYPAPKRAVIVALKSKLKR